MLSKVKFGTPFWLEIKKGAELEDGLKITVDEIVDELIAADPDNPDDYPGSGMTVEVSVKKFIFKKTFELTLLPERYNPQPQTAWKGYTITLIDALSEKVELRVDK